ncbi:MAG TPA: MCE family protein [Phaeodactylibacter sp.]|nr:MCE family protein [Phaeodactylibacter sp.]
MKKEVKVGLLALSAIAIFIWGIKYLQGQNLLTPSQTFYIRYDDVDLLKVASPVVVSGLEVGTVKDIYQDPENLKKIIVEITVDKNVRIPKDTEARLISTSLMGGKAIVLSFERDCSGDDCAQSGDFLTGKTVGFLPSMAGEKAGKSMEEVMAKLSVLLDSIQQQMDTGDKEVLQRGMEDISAPLANLNAASHTLNLMLANSRGDIESALDHTASVTEMLAQQRDAIAQTISHFNAISADLEKAGIGQEISELSNGLKNTMQNLDNALQQFNGLLADLQNGKGSLGLLLNDKELYENLNTTLRHAELLMQDLRLHPKRYTRVLSKKEQPYQAPTEDPGIGN